MALPLPVGSLRTWSEEGRLLLALIWMLMWLPCLVTHIDTLCHSLTHSPTQSLTHSVAHSLTYRRQAPPSYLLTFPSSHPPTHSFIYLQTHTLNLLLAHSTLHTHPGLAARTHITLQRVVTKRHSLGHHRGQFLGRVTLQISVHKRLHTNIREQTRNRLLQPPHCSRTHWRTGWQLGSLSLPH